MAIEGPGHDRDVDEEFARIVAGWEDVATTSGSAALPPLPRMPDAPEEGTPPDGGQPDEAAAGDAATPASPELTDRPEPDEARADPPQVDGPEPSTEPFATAAGPADGPVVPALPHVPAGSDDQVGFGDTGGPPVAGDAESGERPADERRAPEEGADGHELAWRGYAPDDADEHFEPPEPQLPPAHDATYWLAVLGLVAGPLLVLWAVVLSGDPDPGWLIVAGLLLTVGGFGLLIMRGSGERDPDDDGSRV